MADWYEVGDEFEVVADTCHHSFPIGSKVTVTTNGESEDRFYSGNIYFKKQDVKPKNNYMTNLKEKMALVFKGEPEKSFIKAGIMNADETLTSDGQAIFLAWLLKNEGDAFKKEVVDPILAEEK